MKYLLLWSIVMLYLALFASGQLSQMPEGTNIVSPIYNISDEHIEFLQDVTYWDEDYYVNHEIYNEVFAMIDEAEWMVLDMFLFGEETTNTTFPNITAQLTDRLVRSETPYYFVTDPFNTFYGSFVPSNLEQLDNVVYTDLTKLRDSNMLYSPLWKMAFVWFDALSMRGWLPDYVTSSDKQVSIRSIFKLFNFKANHRKLIVTDKAALITSANPHTASGLHSNVGIKVKGPIVEDILKSERSIAQFSGTIISFNKSYGNTTGPMQVQYLTEQRIRDAMLNDLYGTQTGDTVIVAVFYLSDKKVVNALIDAKKRGANVRLVLDANKDAFGREKIGIPNRVVAKKLVKHGIDVVWYDTHGEQFHTKMLVIDKATYSIVYVGSANFTKRNLGNYNLEANVRVVTPHTTIFSQEVSLYIDTVYEHVLLYEAYAHVPWWHIPVYHIQESLGMGTF